MLNAALEFLQSTMEYRAWGFNALTISFIATLGFSIFQGWGVWNQNQGVWREKSGKSVDTPMMLYSLFFFMTYHIYGWQIGSLSIIFNGLLGFLFIPLAIGLWKFDGFTKNDKVYLLISFSLLILIFMVKERDLVVTVAMFMVNVFLYRQVRETYRYGRGVLSGTFILSFLTSTVFWVVYGFATLTVPIMIISPMYLVLWGTIGILWLRDKPHKGRNQRRKFTADDYQIHRPVKRA